MTLGIKFALFQVDLLNGMEFFGIQILDFVSNDFGEVLFLFGMIDENGVD